MEFKKKRFSDHEQARYRDGRGS